MARLATPLTDTRIRQTPAAAKPIKLADGGGMYLLMRPDGSRYWRLDYRYEGKRKTLALGVYPEVSLAEARKRRHSARTLLAAGHDPAALKKAERAGFASAIGADGQTHALAMLGEGVWEWTLASGEVRHNAQWAHLMGLNPEHATHTWQEALDCLPRQERGTVMAALRDCLAGAPRFECEHRIHQPDGSVIWVSNRGKVVARDVGGKPLRMVGSLHEITAQKREALATQRHTLFLQTIAALGELFMAELAEQALLSHICAELVRGDLYRVAWVGLLDDAGSPLRPVAAAGLPVDALAGVSDCTGALQPNDPIGNAIRLGATVVNNDIEIDSLNVTGRKQARALGYRSFAATPLRMHGRVAGMLCLYSQEPEAFGIDILMLLERLAADLGAALAHRAALAALHESEARFRLLLDASPEAIFGVDTQGRCTFVNPACLAMLGYTQEEMLGQSLHPLIHHTYPDGRPYPREACHLRHSTLQGLATHVDSEVHWRKDGTCFPVEYWSHPMYRDGELVGAVVNFIDISERRSTETALRESEARFRAMAEQSTDWIWSADTAGHHTYSNTRGIASLGYSPDAFLALPPGCLVHPDDLPLYRETFDQACATRQGWHNVVLRWRHQNGSYRIFESNASPVFDESGTLTGFQGVDRDVTERKQAEARIEFLAHHDALTGLPNRVLLRDRFEHALATAERSRTRVAMLFLDLDNFKVVNDTLGHAAGDQLLLTVVARLAECTRESDTMSRQGGDEFIVLLGDMPDLEAVERIASKILAQLAEPVELNGHALNAACSIGIAMYPDDGASFDTLLQKADAAMYNAKGAGRNTYQFFDEQMNRQAHEHLLLQNRLSRALYGAEFHLHYQPQLEIGSGRVVGVEALLRWHNPELGDVPPARFIPVAENCGLIVSIGAWVMEEACRQAQSLRQAGSELIMSVNLSALQFRRAGLVETVSGALARSGLPPHMLELELTESILLQDVDNTLDTVRQLKALGVRLAIDDFGTGYSSLSYLKRFAVDRLKIDRSFVSDVTTDPDSAAIVRAIIQLAASLRLGIVAEGVETAAQLAFLRESGCEDIQGFLFSRPLAMTDLKTFLKQHSSVSTLPA
ncbi:MAG: EAL domain-containing protein [Thiobacillus sp.]|nr:EAL domain-containing protein [Thiobacillus sp.]